MLDDITNSKILSPDEILNVLSSLQLESKKIVFTNGCFDIIHTGHTRYLREARLLGDKLLVAVNSDNSIKRLKGEKRPIVPLEERLEILAGFYFIDFVTWFSEDTPLNVIKKIKPNILVKGGDWNLDDIVGKDDVEKSGGIVTTIPEILGVSTTSIIDRVLDRY